MQMTRNLQITLFSMLILASSQSPAAEKEQWISTTSGCMVSASNAMVKDVKVSWSGSCPDGYADGKGTLSWSNGNRYAGEVYVGAISGKGTFYWSNGDWYQGDFKNGRREGIGTQHFVCSGQYHGEFHNGVMDGIGVLHMADGNGYEGEFRNGVMQGLGVRTFADGSKYQGEFKHNQQEGLGTLFLANHSRYEGEFKNNRPEGNALVTDANQNLFEGMYIDGHADGRGILTKPNGERDVGVFKDHKGTLKLVSTLGPQLYEPCQTHCSTTITSCGGNAIAGIAPDDPMYQMKLMNASVSCGREMQQCTTMCERHNPTVVELKGIVEVGEVDDPANAPVDKSTQVARTRDAKSSDAKTLANKQAVSFADQQAATTAELRAHLVIQHQQLQTLQQQLATLANATASDTAPTSQIASDCKSTTRHKN
jgi:hypothetical protein